MRVEFLQTIDFNQMLVYSTFVHLFFLMIVVFLPSPKMQEQIVVPTFKLDLIELPSAAKPAPTPRKKQKVVSSIVKKRVASKPKLIAKKQERREIKVLKSKVLPPPKPMLPKILPPPKPMLPKILPPPKPITKESKTNKKVLEDLESLQRSAPKKSILQKLDEVAQVIPKPKEKKAPPPKPMKEETFEETQRKEVPKLPLKSKEVKVQSLSNDSEEKIQRKKVPKLPLKSKEVKVQPLTDDLEIETKKSDPVTLLNESDQTARLKRTTASDLIKKLEAIERKKTFPVDTVVEQKQPEELNPAVDPYQVNRKPLVSVAEKFKALEELSEEVRMDISQDQVIRREFKTVIRRDEVPTFETDSEFEKSSILSAYVGKVYKRVYSKWKTPLGSKFKKVVVAFTVFSNGNIDKPLIRESSGNENLDSIAVRAILDAVPFPTLPKEMNRPNLRISIIFKYVPEKK